MYNGIGLATVRGTATNGYVQRNLSHVRTQQVRNQIAQNKGALKDWDAPQQKQPNKAILDHQKKREIEAKVFELQVKLEEDGLTEQEIAEQCEELKAKLEVDQVAALFSKGAGSHAVAARKAEEDRALRAAFGIRDDFVEGAAFDPELQAQIKQKREEEKQRKEEERIEQQKKREEEREARRLQREQEEAERIAKQLAAEEERVARRREEEKERARRLEEEEEARQLRKTERLRNEMARELEESLKRNRRRRRGRDEGSDSDRKEPKRESVIASVQTWPDIEEEEENERDRQKTLPKKRRSMIAPQTERDKETELPHQVTKAGRTRQSPKRKQAQNTPSQSSTASSSGSSSTDSSEASDAESSSESPHKNTSKKAVPRAPKRWNPTSQPSDEYEENDVMDRWELEDTLQAALDEQKRRQDQEREYELTIERERQMMFDEEGYHAPLSGKVVHSPSRYESDSSTVHRTKKKHNKAIKRKD